MRVRPDAGEGEFRHAGLADDDRPGLAKATDGRGVFGRGGCILENARARPRRLTGNVEQVLDADDDPVQRTEAGAVACTPVSRVGLGPRAVGINGQEGARALPCRVPYPLKRGFEAFANQDGLPH
jgi:hypothetical protein